MKAGVLDRAAASRRRVAAALLGLVLSACAGEGAEEAPSGEDAAVEQPADAAAPGGAGTGEAGAGGASDPLPITLEAVNESGVEGRATKIQIADSLQMSVMVQGLPREGDYQAHIHRGTCVTGGAVLVPLNPVHASSDGMGRSMTMIAATRLPAGEPHFVQVHGGQGVLACGDVHSGEGG